MYIMEKKEKTPILGSIIILYKNNALWGLIDIEKKSSLLRLKEVNFQKKKLSLSGFEPRTFRPLRGALTHWTMACIYIIITL